VRSTAGLLNFRFSSGVRTTGKPDSAECVFVANARPAVMIEVWWMNCRRFITAGPVYLAEPVCETEKAAAVARAKHAEQHQSSGAILRFNQLKGLLPV